ncbi:MAG: carbonic anhydrase [Gammaproteobacteria bacterium]
MITAREALTRLKQGNQDFLAIDRSHIEIDAGKRTELIKEQKPFAIILGCSDSRVPAEIIFAQGLGDLFVIRIAGNIVAPSQIGSIEFAAEQFGTRLVVVLGHSSCGAVSATLEQLKNPGEARSANLHSIVSRIVPGIEHLTNDGSVAPEELLGCAVRANIEASVKKLRHGSAILEDLVTNDGLLIVGAEYNLESGVIDFFDDAD